MLKLHQTQELLHIIQLFYFNYQKCTRLISQHPKFLNHHLHKMVALLKAKCIKAHQLIKYHSFHHNHLQVLLARYNKAL